MAGPGMGRLLNSDIVLPQSECECTVRQTASVCLLLQRGTKSCVYKPKMKLVWVMCICKRSPFPGKDCGSLMETRRTCVTDVAMRTKGLM